MPREAENMIEYAGGEHYSLWTGTTGSQQQQLALTLDSEEWYTWLSGLSSFRFRGSTGKYTARKESRARGSAYWIAYRKASKKLHKLYIGKSEELSIAKLEQVAGELAVLCGDC